MIEKIYSFECVILGDTNCGKTSIVEKLTKGIFEESTNPTIGVEFCIKKYYNLKDKKIKLRLWNVCGGIRFRDIAKIYYKNSKAFILVYDISCRSTFESIDSWLEDIGINKIDSILMLIGNKSDVLNRKITKEEGKQYAEEKKMFFMETSAKNGENIETVFELLTNEIYKSIQSVENVESQTGVKIEYITKIPKSRMCGFFW